MKRINWLVAVILCWSTIQANTIYVQNNNNSGTGSLREIVANAQDGDIIRFNPSINGQVINIATPINIAKSIHIIGNGHVNTIVSCVSTEQAVFTIQQGQACFISQLTVQTAMNGIISYGKLFLHKCEVKNVNYFGVQAAGDTLKIKFCYIHHAGTDGVRSGNASATYIQHSTISNNSGIGLNKTVEGPLFLEGNTITANGTGVNTLTSTTAAPMNIVNNTIAGNTQHGLVINNSSGSANPANVNVINNILYGNVGKSFHVISSTGSNPFQKKNIVDSTDTALGTITWYSKLNPQLDAGGLKMNGGLWPTLALTAGSVNAIDSADMSSAKPHDGRGYTRSGKPDIGAYEFNGQPCEHIELIGFIPDSIQVCANDTAHFVVQAIADGTINYQWEANMGNGFAPLSNGADFSGVNTHDLKIIHALPNMHQAFFRCVVSNSCFNLSSKPSALKLKQFPGSSTIQHLLCNGSNDGSITINVPQGNNSYTYSWSVAGQTNASITGLSAGTYTCTIIENAMCNYVNTFTVNQPPAIQITVNTAQINCSGGNNGSITASVSGGVQPYTYFWAPNGAITPTISSLAAGSFTCTVTDANGCTQGKTAVLTDPTALQLTITPNHPACYGGQDGKLTATASGGTPPYSYLWQPGTGNTAIIQSLGAGTYTCIVTDSKGCQKSEQITLTNPAAIQTTMQGTNPSCNGSANGSASITVNGGTPAYSYSWIPSIGSTPSHSNLNAGKYICTVTDGKGCTKKDSVQLTEPTALQLVLTPNHPKCDGGQDGNLSATASGGTQPYTYLWQPGGENTAMIQSLGAGTYTCMVTDNKGCQKSQQMTLTSPPAMQTAMQKTNPSCNGAADGSASITVSGGTPAYSYSWLPTNGASANLSNLNAGKYICTVTDNKGCIKKDSVQLTDPAALQLTLTPNHPVCNNANNGKITATVSVGTQPYTYLWQPGSGNTAMIQSLGAGTYTCTVTDSKGCQKSQQMTLNNPPLIQTSIQGTNPICHGDLSGTADITVTGGVQPYTYLWLPGQQTSTSLSNLGAGKYLCRVTDAGGCIKKDSIVITQPEPIRIYGSTSNCYSSSSSCNGRMYYNVVGGTVPPGGSAAFMVEYFLGSTPIANPYYDLCPGTYTIKAKDPNGCLKTATAIVPQPTQITINFTITNNECDRYRMGKVVANVSSNSTSQFNHFHFDWRSTNPYFTPSYSNVIDRLESDTYTLTVRDMEGCSTTSTATVTSPPPFKLNATTTAPSCGLSNGQITTAPSGGTPPYSMYWSSGHTTTQVSGFTAGYHHVTVSDSKHCRYHEHVYLHNSSGPTVSINQVKNVSCAGKTDGAVNINISGGQMPYSIKWSNGATTEDLQNVAATAYDVEVKDATGCKASLTAIVSEPDSLLLIKTAKTTGKCGDADGSATIAVTGGTSPYTYQWNSAAMNQTTATANNLKAGYYKCWVTDARSCSDTVVVAVNDPNSPEIKLDSIRNAGCLLNGHGVGAIYISVNGGGSPYTYLWSNGATTEDVQTLGRGNFSVLVTDAAGCKSSLVKYIDGQTPGTAQICLVTVDTSNNHTVIYWEKNVPGVAEYKIYRETIVQDNYALLATVPAANFSRFEDTLADANVKPWKYKILVTDSCGRKSTFSVQHKCLHLAVIIGSGVANLSWDAYEGFAFNKYYIMRKNSISGWVLIDSVQNNITAYTDNTPPPSATDIEYMIEVKPQLPCNPGKASINTSRSNIKTARVQQPVGIAHWTQGHPLQVSPNPATNKLNVRVNQDTKISIVMYDIEGRLVLQEKAQGNTSLDIQSLAGGIYTLTVQFEDGLMKRVKVIKQE